MDSFPDDIFGTLGGSLMKDLLADLQVDEGDFSLEQLERELETMEDAPPQFQNHPIPALDAASLVVSHQQQVPSMLPPVGHFTSQGVDAWSLSLQNFTAMSLQDDFLAADSARKKQQILQPTMLEGAEDYDIAEKVKVGVPPGLGTSNLLSPPVPVPFPKTPANSIIVTAEEAASIKNAVTILPPTSSTVPPSVKSAPQGPQPMLSTPLPPHTVPLPTVPLGQAPSIPLVSPQGVPPAMPMTTPLMIPPQGMPPPQIMPPQGPVPMVPPAARGPAWQTPIHPAPQPVRRVFCNPHPAAPPIPATALETKYMSARDIAYVIHAILKPVLVQGISEDDYFVLYLRRLGGQASASMPQKPKDVDGEMLSRAMKSKEWSSEKGVLGHVAKSNVARPRALIATPTVAVTEQDSEQKQRATLWKARIYCDQGYQAYQAIVDIWSSAPAGSIPPQIQMHLVKLMKCMGITNVDKEYKLERDSLTLLIKLSKGRNLTARVLEQALLPPNAVQALLPLLMDVLFGVISKKSADDNMDDLSVERLFRAITVVLQQLNTTSDTLLQCFEAVQKNGRTSLGSSARMECAHTLLQKGSAVLGQEPSEEKRAAWGRAEGEFMNLLQAF